MDQDIVRASETKSDENSDENSGRRQEDPISGALRRDDISERSQAQAENWAARSVPRREDSHTSDRFDFGALKILLILIALTVVMTLTIRFLI